MSFKSATGFTCTPSPLVLQPAASGSCVFHTAGSYSYSDPNTKGNTFPRVDHGDRTARFVDAGRGNRCC